MTERDDPAVPFIPELFSHPVGGGGVHGDALIEEAPAVPPPPGYGRDGMPVPACEPDTGGGEEGEPGGQTR